MTVTEIIWHDAHSEGVSGGTWFESTEIKNEPYVVRSVGIVVDGAKDGHVTLAQSVSITDGLMDSVLHIPTGMIASRRELV